MSNRLRRQFTGRQKTEILKRHLLDRVAVSDFCDEYKIQPAQFCDWQKQLFETGKKAFERGVNPLKASATLQKQRIAKLEAMLVQKNEVVAELRKEHVKLKKN